MSTADINHKYTACVYIVFTVITLLGIIQIMSYGQYFHLPVFTFFVLAYLIGFMATRKYNIAVELRIVRIMIVFLIITMICTCVMFFARPDLDLVVHIPIIVFLKTLWLFHRQACLKLLWREALQVAEYDRCGIRFNPNTEDSQEGGGGNERN